MRLQKLVFPSGLHGKSSHLVSQYAARSTNPQPQCKGAFFSLLLFISREKSRVTCNSENGITHLIPKIWSVCFVKSFKRVSAKLYSFDVLLLLSKHCAQRFSPCLICAIDVFLPVRHEASAKGTHCLRFSVTCRSSQIPPWLCDSVAKLWLQSSASFSTRQSVCLSVSASVRGVCRVCLSSCHSVRVAFRNSLWFTGPTHPPYFLVLDTHCSVV